VRPTNSNREVEGVTGRIAQLEEELRMALLKVEVLIEWLEPDNHDVHPLLCDMRDDISKTLAEPPVSSKDKGCDRRQEAARRLVESWRDSSGDCRQLAIDYPNTGAIQVQRASVYEQCAKELESTLNEVEPCT